MVAVERFVDNSFGGSLYLSSESCSCAFGFRISDFGYLKNGYLKMKSRFRIFNSRISDIYNHPDFKNGYLISDFGYIICSDFISEIWILNIRI